MQIRILPPPISHCCANLAVLISKMFNTFDKIALCCGIPIAFFRINLFFSTQLRGVLFLYF